MQIGPKDGESSLHQSRGHLDADGKFKTGELKGLDYLVERMGLKEQEELMRCPGTCKAESPYDWRGQGRE